MKYWRVVSAAMSGIEVGVGNRSAIHTGFRKAGSTGWTGLDQGGPWLDYSESESGFDSLADRLTELKNGLDWVRDGLDRRMGRTTVIKNISNYKSYFQSA
jgi:hypothetical protein